MICFNTENMHVYNYIIHNILEIEIFGDNDIDIGDIIEDILPKYLYREQYKKCVQKFEELYEWTSDKFFHDMTAFHELILYNFIEYVAQSQDDIEDFRDIYFDKKARKLIREASKKELEEYGAEDGFTLEDMEENFYDLRCYADRLFEELDFLLIPDLYNLRKLDCLLLEERLGINIDYYKEILPMDIQEKYKTHINMTGEVHELLYFIQEKVHHGSLVKLFWEGDKQINEARIQVILENLMDAYFYKQDIEITREALLGSGKVDFKLYRNNQENEKILIEVKKAKSSYLKKGYEQQILKYMESSDCKNSFYLIVCFTDKEYEKAKKFIRENVYTDNYRLYINISILDVRKKTTASKMP